MAAMRAHAALASLLCGCLAACAPSPADEVALLQTALAQEPASETPEGRLQAAMDLAKERVAAGEHPASTDIKQPMVNFGDAQYVSYMQMGKQMISGIIDTGSFELVVFGSDCQSCSVAAHYSHYLSETFEQGSLSTVHNYGSGGAACNEAFEQVSMGPFPAVRQMFWEVVDAQMPVLQNAAFESIIGVGPTEAAILEVWNEVDDVVKNLTSFYDRAMVPPEHAVMDAQQMVKIALKLGSELPMLHSWGVDQFSICMGTGHGADGVIVWNDTQPVTHGERFVTVPVLGETHTWSASLTAPALVHADSTSVSLVGCANGCEALIDSGTSLLAAPTLVLNSILDAMNVLEPDCSNLDVLPTLNFKLGDHDFSLPPSAYIAKLSGEMSGYVENKLPRSMANVSHTSRQCELVMMDTGDFGNSALWILGMPFFRKYYTNFRLGSTLEEREFRIAPHSEEECMPEDPAKLDMAVDRKPQRPREIQANRLHLPHPRRQSQKRSHRKWSYRE